MLTQILEVDAKRTDDDTVHEEISLYLDMLYQGEDS